VRRVERRRLRRDTLVAEACEEIAYGALVFIGLEVHGRPLSSHHASSSP
jgi:hypothetical protein